MNERSSTNDIVEFVNGLTLKSPKQAFPTARSRAASSAEITKEGQEQAFLNDKSVVSFTTNVKDQARQDILNSILLAQLAANKTHSLEKDMNQWYEAFVAVLGKVGWVVEKAETNTFKSKKNVFEVDGVIIDILVAAFGSSYLPIIKSVLNAFKTLGDNDDKRIRAFEKNTQTQSKGCFQIALANDENGAITMQLGTFLLTSENEIKKILFVKFSKDQTTLEYSSRKATLATDVYNVARKAVIDKLSTDTIAYITEIEI